MKNKENNTKKHEQEHTRNAAKIVGNIALVLGVVIAISVENESWHEFTLRAIGTALAVGGAWLAGYLKKENENDENNGTKEID